MSSFYNFHRSTSPASLQMPMAQGWVQHAPHQGRSRRTPRLSVSQGPTGLPDRRPKHPRQVVRDADEPSPVARSALVFRERFETSRSFDLEDDLEFCPGLITDEDVIVLSSTSSSERSSLASNSPTSSPTQLHGQVATSFSLNSSSPPFIPPAYGNSSHTSPLFVPHMHSTKLHQPSATRARNAIPIVNPATGTTMASPPPSVSPSSMQRTPLGRRW